MEGLPATGVLARRPPGSSHLSPENGERSPFSNSWKTQCALSFQTLQNLTIKRNCTSGKGDPSAKAATVAALAQDARAPNLCRSSLVIEPSLASEG